MRMARILGVAVALCLAALTTSASAVAVTDTLGDFLPTFVPGDDPTTHSDVDVISSEVRYNPGENLFQFIGTHAADIGTSLDNLGNPGGFYVWGLDRGQGTERLAAIVDGVLFDSVVVLTAAGTGFFLDLIPVGATPVPIDPVTISGPTISAFVPGSIIPSLGVFAPEDYTWNLWPRFLLDNSLGQIFTDNAAVSDFAPDASNAALTLVPEPLTLANIAIGLIALVGFARRRASQ